MLIALVGSFSIPVRHQVPILWDPFAEFKHRTGIELGNWYRSSDSAGQEWFHQRIERLTHLPESRPTVE
jgi:hypothetical protein